ncbi:MAG: hypothetical protein K0R28_1122 [Paenibacillus sp.]|jgi:hypothetical protein|nr:hypothetical protein [Paenibacillus sp.]
MRLEQHMDMIEIMIPLAEGSMILSNMFKHVFCIRGDLISQNLSTVFDTKDEMVVQ